MQKAHETPLLSNPTHKLTISAQVLGKKQASQAAMNSLGRWLSGCKTHLMSKAHTAQTSQGSSSFQQRIELTRASGGWGDIALE